MKPRIAVALQAKSISELRKLIKKAEKKADFLELRLDYLSNFNGIKNLLKTIHKPTILTLRPTWEGGKYKGSEAKRINTLKDLIPLTKFLDIELDSKRVAEIKTSCKRAGTKLIISKHFFNSTPTNKILKKILKKQISLGADICKLVTFANKFEDNLTVLDLVRLTSKKTKIVSFCMGELGVASRILSTLEGAYFTFACLEYGKETAKGQVSINDMLKLYDLLV
ncbi:type I 3-dehydroquinate dehydratase [Candidatus Micrarchaeota archaeon]|nr:type I 3-dehydroquinate dehydratase [Candidatus Micrarchaeota archaeon]